MIRTFIERVWVVIAIIFIAWFGISYLDIVTHNLDGGSTASWNLFNIWLGFIK